MSERRPGPAALALAVTFLVALGFLAWWLTRPAFVPPPPKISFSPSGFGALKGWADDDQAAALAAFLISCRRFGRWADAHRVGPPELGLSAADWKPACAAAPAVPAGDTAAARAFFEAAFTPLTVAWGGETQGLFTGYYEPLLRGSRRRDDRFRVALHRRPDDLVRVELGRFDPALQGKRIAGRVVGAELEPYPDRAAIEAGALRDELALVWVDDPIDAFFLHIQGSGRVRLEDGGELRLRYADQNGRRYHAIGRELIRRGALSRETVSMQSIRAWLQAHPEEAAAVMGTNPSYVFFQELRGPGPLGALGVPLTPGRSIAVDRRLLPLGAPLWLEASHPDADAGRPDRPLNRLMLAQDTGGAITGAVRGDVFWGHGDEAYEIAGRMKHPGRWYLLLPKAAAARLAGG